MRCKQLSVSTVKFAATAMTLAALAMPFKAKADQLEQTVAKPTIAEQTTVEMFYQYRKGDGHEAGAGFDTSIGTGSTKLGLGIGIAANLETGTTLLETAGAKFTFPITSPVSATTYLQRSRFLGNQNAVGGVLHARIDPVVLHTGTEYDFVTHAVPVFLGADFDLGKVAISPTVIVPIVPEQDNPNLGGTIKITMETKGPNFFLRAFGMTNPTAGTLLVGNVQIGVGI